MSQLKDLQAVVVLYNMKINESLTIKTLISALSAKRDYKLDILIYDNSIYEQDVNQVSELNIDYTHNSKNPGVGKAYNEGYKLANTKKKKWLLLLDQDTTFPKDFFSVSFQTLNDNDDISLFVPILKLNNGLIFSPCLNKHKRGYPLKSVTPGKYKLSKYSAVNSGMIIRTEAFKNAGGYNEKIRLDFADFQFLEKFRINHDQFCVTKVICEQTFSGFDKSLFNQQNRFELYLNDAINCEKKSLRDKIEFFYTVTRHTLGLTIKMKNSVFLKLYIKNYLCSN